MPGATTARLVVLAWLMPMKEFMMPQTVPNRPTKGAVEPIVASRPVPRAIERPARASIRESAMATRSLMPSWPRSAERRVSASAAASNWPTAPRSLPFLPAAAPAAALRLSAASIRRSARPAERLAAASSIALASQIVQVTREAKASPSITPFTTISAAMNMPQGDRSCGKAAVTTGAATGAAGLMMGVRGGWAALGGLMPSWGRAGGRALVGAVGWLEAAGWACAGEAVSAGACGAGWPGT